MQHNIGAAEYILYSAYNTHTLVKLKPIKD